MGGTIEQQRVALVTGGARGIGLAIALRLHAGGYRVATCDVGDSAGADGIRSYRVSVTDREDMAAMVERIAGEWGRLDVLVNNAAINRAGDVFSQTDDQWERVLAVNLTGAFVASAVCAPLMREQGYGRIVNIGSIGGAGFGGSPAYAASKAGLIGLTKELARELGPHGVTVNLVAPGVVRTEWVERNMGDAALESAARRAPTGRAGEPEDIAAIVAFLASAESRHVTGQVISASGGVWMP